MTVPDHKCALRLGDFDEGLLLNIIRLSTQDLRNGSCADYKAATAAYTSISLVSRQWRRLLRECGPLSVRIATNDQLARLAESTSFPLAELELQGQVRGIQMALAKVLESDLFRRTSGPTLQRICGLESSAIPAAFLMRHARHFPNLQTLDGVWGVPRSGLPAGIRQLGLMDTLHYVGYEYAEIGVALQPLQNLQVLSLRGVAVNLEQLPSSVQVLLTCDCSVRGAETSKLREQPHMAGRYNIFISGGSKGGTVRLLMHFFNGFPAHWETSY